MKRCTAVVHAGSAMGAAFTQYTAEFEASGELGATSVQRFLYVIEGEIKVESGGKVSKLLPRGYAYFPVGAAHSITAAHASRVAVIEKPYRAVAGVEPPKAVVSNEDAIASHSLDGD